jgi:hypothetical protein
MTINQINISATWLIRSITESFADNNEFNSVRYFKIFENLIRND